jgi:S-methylmethionine-dependent homocysteine/selenocysteine methylase
LFLTDSGLETDLVFNHGIDLPHFAAFPLLADHDGQMRLVAYYQDHIAVAAACGSGFLLETPTWRASQDWADAMGITAARLDEMNRDAVAMMRQLRDKHGTAQLPMVISGCIGPRGDGYRADPDAEARSAAVYHSAQIASFAAAGVDLVSAITMTSVAESIGIAQAAVAAGLPVVISFTLETDGKLPDGSSLEDAIVAVDAATDAAPAYFMINCAHPDHFSALLASPAPWQQRLRGIRANASTLSHAELDVMTSLDAGDPKALAAAYRALVDRLPQLTVLGGCCGTDCRHIAAIAERCTA